MRLMRNETSTLSAIVRKAFDGEPLGDLNKGENRQRCQEPHLSIIGMITPEELPELLKNRSEMHNGFLNRFLLVNVKRTRYLACGADYGKVCHEYASHLRQAIETATTLREPFGVAEEAIAFWNSKYRRLETERPSNYGKATARLSVHALKVAMLYAALDGVNAIGLRHLRAALALIDHADRTAFDLFGTAAAVAPGDEPDHAKLLTFALTRQDGITKTDAHDLFSRKRSAAQIADMFAWLTPAFGDWRNGRWFAREHLPESDMGGGGVSEPPAPSTAADGAPNAESSNGTDAHGVKEGL
jgi:hypothetical protein